MAYTRSSWQGKKGTKLDSVRQYLDEISKTPLLDGKGEEQKLAKRIEAGVYAEHLLATDPTIDGEFRVDMEQIVMEGKQAKDKFLRANVRLVVAIARRYVRASVSLLDNIQNGNIGLMRALDKFDYKRGLKFSTYATWWIRQNITRALPEEARSIRLPVHLAEEVSHLQRDARLYAAEHDAWPTAEELAEFNGGDFDRISKVMVWSMDLASLDTQIGEGDATLGDFIADESASPVEETVIDAQGVEQLYKFIDRLDDRAAAIMRAKYGLDDGQVHTLSQVAKYHSLSRERIRQIEVQSLGRLRRMYSDTHQMQ